MYRLTHAAHELVQSTYNLKHRYVQAAGSARMVNLLMSPENATIGFICKALEGTTETRRQFRVGSKAVDLYLPEINVVVECDERGHRHYDAVAERHREEFIRGRLGCTFLRYDPADGDFRLAEIIKCILEMLRTNRRSGP